MKTPEAVVVPDLSLGAGRMDHSRQHLAEADAIETLNRDCYCVSLDQDALRTELEADLGARGLSRPLLETHPHLFASLPVFVSRRHVERMAQIIAAVESVVGMAAYRDAVMQWAPDIAAFDPGPCGVFLGYDFHLGPAGPQLIEINTNAGGALLNAVLGRAQRACCQAMEELVPRPEAFASVEAAIFDMFMYEWRLQRRFQELKCAAIIDDNPGGQYLYPEFLLFQQLFRRNGIDAIIADPRQLVLRQGALRHADKRIDLVYNRLTDFSLELPVHAVLSDAYLSGQVVLTPHPRCGIAARPEAGLAQLRLQRRSAVARRAPVSGPDHQLPHAGRWFRARVYRR